MVPLMPMNSTNKAKVQAWIKSWTTTGGEDSGYVKANGESTGAVQQEAWAYFAGKTGLSGRNYAATRPASACGKNYIIFVANAFTTNGTPGESGSLTASPPLWGEASAEMNAVPVATDAQKTLITGTLKTSCTSGTSGSSSGSYTFPSSRTQHDKGDYADEWTRYMNQTLGIITYTVGLLNADRTKCKPQYPALLSSMATVGLGKYFETDNYADLKTAFDTALSEIQAINSVFASPAYR
jgi:type IV pilus assembly protein PilY1